MKIANRIGRAARARRGRRRRSGSRFTQRGVALIAVTIAISVIAVLTVEFSANTTTTWVGATNHRDQMKAEFLTRSSMEIAEVLIRAQQEFGGAMDAMGGGGGGGPMDADAGGLGGMNPMGMMGGGDLTEFSGLISTAIGGSREEAAALASTIGLPVDPDDLRGLGLENGRFTIRTEPEDGRINLNCANGSESTRENLRAQLLALFYFEAYDPIFQEPSADGWRRSREEQVDAMIDYVRRFGSARSARDYGYESLDDPYEPKDNYIDTVSQLRLVRGVDERFWSVFGDYFTVYGECAINLGEVTSPRIVASLILLAAEEDDHPVLRDEDRLWELSRAVLETQELMGRMGFDSVESFASLVEDPAGGLEQVLARELGFEDDVDAAAAEPELGAAGGDVQGVPLDAEKLGEIATSGRPRVYRVEATAEIGEDFDWMVERRVRGVWDTETRNQNARDPAYRQGTWVYFREE